MRTFLFILILSFVLIGCGNKQETKQESESDSGEDITPLQKIETFSLEGYAQGSKKRWQIEGKSADVFEEVVKLDNVVAKVYGDEGELNLKSDKGEYDRKEGRVHLEDNVVVTTSEGAKIKTDSLDWDAQKQSVATEQDVFIEKDNLSCQGKGAFALPEMKKVKIKEGVKVEIKPKTTITCSGPLELDYDKNIAIFYDNVEVEDERGKIFSDKMEVYFQPKTKEIDKIFAFGNVRIIQGENTAYSDEAVYNSALGKVTLKGNPKLVIYPESKDKKPETSNQ